MTTKSCETCRFYMEPTEHQKSHCRRYPPTVLLNQHHTLISRVPAVSPGFWCGEWQDIVSSEQIAEVEEWTETA